MTVPLNKLFNVTYGNKFDLNKMELLPKKEGGVNFVGRSSQNHGVSATVAPLAGTKPYPAGCITVALGGTKLLSSFVQLEPFYTAQNVAVLSARSEMSLAEKLYLCMCIRHNRFRYSAFGREANRTLRTLEVPSRSEFPEWLKTAQTEALSRDLSVPRRSGSIPDLEVAAWRHFKLSSLFEIKKGKRLTKVNAREGDTAFVASIESNNGLRQRVSAKPRHPSGVITVNYNGSVAEAFYQPEAFFASDDVCVLYPRFEMTEFVALFICTIIRQEKYRFNYGRKWNLERMKESSIKLPATESGKPDFEFMDDFMRRLPYSSGVDADFSRQSVIG